MPERPVDGRSQSLRAFGREAHRTAIMEGRRRQFRIDSENAIRLLRPFRSVSFGIPGPTAEISQMLGLPRGTFIHFRVAFGIRKTIRQDTHDRSFQEKKDALTYCLAVV